MRGPFQQLFPPGTYPAAPGGETLSEEFGPDNPGHVDSGWCVDAKGNNEMDDDDGHLFCLLLGLSYRNP